MLIGDISSALMQLLWHCIIPWVTGLLFFWANDKERKLHINQLPPAISEPFISSQSAKLTFVESCWGEVCAEAVHCRSVWEAMLFCHVCAPICETNAWTPYKFDCNWLKYRIGRFCLLIVILDAEQIGVFGHSCRGMNICVWPVFVSSMQLLTLDRAAVRCPG